MSVRVATFNPPQVGDQASRRAFSELREVLRQLQLMRDDFETRISTLEELEERVDGLEEDVEDLQGTFAGGKFATIGISAVQTTNIAVNNHIEFDTITDNTGGLVTLATGAGQADGIITLAEGHKYMVFAMASGNCNEGNVALRWTDTGHANVPDEAGGASFLNSLADAVGTDTLQTSMIATVFDATSASIEMVFNITSATNLVNLNGRVYVWPVT